MNIKNNGIITLLVLLMSFQIYAQDFKIGIQDSITSTVLNEVRNFIVVTPSSYNKYTSSRYPVTYILDGDFLLQSTSGMIEYMSKTGEVPEMIEVYISNVNRTKDFTPSKTTTNYEDEIDESLSESGGGKNFLNFINTELIPYIDENFRTNSFNTLVGRSLAGLIGGYDYLQKDSKLNGYLLIDPSFWWDNQFTVTQIDSTSLKNLTNKKIYIASSDNFEFSDDIKLMRESQNSFYENLKNKGVETTKLKIDYFEDYTHGTVTIPSLHQGLLFIFDNYFLKGMKYKTADQIISHFLKYSKDNNAGFPPLEGMINWLASLQKETSDSLKLYQLNTENYPESINAHLNLAETFEKLGRIKEALNEYKEVLKLDSNNEVVSKKIIELERK